jgi:mono/diheme cytochrome c family protein
MAIPSVLSYFWVGPAGDAAMIMNFSKSISPCPGVAVAILALLALAGCDAERRRSDAELGLNSQQAAGRQLYDNYCDRCHEPYSSRGKKGPSLKGVFKQQYLSLSGLPANDERVGEIVKYGRSKMEGFGQVVTDQQIKDLLAYLHTL